MSIVTLLSQVTEHRHSQQLSVLSPETLLSMTPDVFLLQAFAGLVFLIQALFFFSYGYEILVSSTSSLVSISNYPIYGFQLWALLILANGLYDFLIIYYDDLNDDGTYSWLALLIFAIYPANFISIFVSLYFFSK